MPRQHLFVFIAALTQAAAIAAAQPILPFRGQEHWTAFSADLHIEWAGRPDANVGRVYRDAHGCERTETPLGPGGSTIITIQNFERQMFYRLFNGQWTAQAMRMPMRTRPPMTGLQRLAEPHEGYEVFERATSTRRPDGTTVSRREIIAPALDDFRVLTEVTNGTMQVARNIRVGPQPRELFEPPPGTELTQKPGFGGAMQFAAVVVDVRARGGNAVSLTTGEGRPVALSSPQTADTLWLMTEVVDEAKLLVRVRIMRNPRGRPGEISGELVDEVQIALGETGRTTKLTDNLELTVTRIGLRRAPQR